MYLLCLINLALLRLPRGIRQKWDTDTRVPHTWETHQTSCAYGPNARCRGPLVPVRKEPLKGSADVPEAVRQSAVSRSSRMASALGNRIVKPTWKVAKLRMSYGALVEKTPETYWKVLSLPP
jgi:hypothetical protein